MQQSQFMSLVEVVFNTALGLCVAFVATHLICEAYSIPMSHQNNLILTAWMTVVSVLRSYIVRRVFNRIKNGR